MLTWKWIPLFIPVILCGCAHGIDRTALQERLNDGSVQMTDATVTEIRGLKPQLRFPCRVAVYLKPSNTHEWRWTPEDKVVLDQLTAVLKKEGIVADVFPLPEIIVGKGDVKELRVAAAQCGADAIFMVHGAAQTDSYQNFASVLNLTLLGGFIVPGSHKDTLFLIEGALIDVDNAYIYTAVQAEGVGKIMRPTFVIEERESVTLAKKQAVAQFAEEALKRLRWLAVTTQAGSAAPIAPPAVYPSIRTFGGTPTAAAKPAPATPATGLTQTVHTALLPPSGFMSALMPTGLLIPNMPVPALNPPPLIPPPLSEQPRPSGLMTTISNARPTR